MKGLVPRREGETRASSELQGLAAGAIQTLVWGGRRTFAAG